LDKTDPTLVNKDERHLLRMMLIKDPEHRMSAKQCLEHPMFQNVQVEAPDNRFQSEDFNYIESEYDFTQKENIAKYECNDIRVSFIRK
jgi:serine/threonine protein kinase